MELKTIIRVHGALDPKDFSGINNKSLIIENNEDKFVNSILADGWLLFDVQLFFENGIVFDTLYFAKDTEDGEDGNMNILMDGNDDSDDINNILRGLRDN